MKKILVNIYLFYIRFFAKLQLKKIKPLIIGIGGASGKSSLAQAVYSVLRHKYIVKTSKGKNSETGIPLDILGIEIKDYTYVSWIKAAFSIPFKFIFSGKNIDIYIVEMGIDSPLPPKNMSYLLKILKPNIAVLTNITIEHSLYFDPLVKENDEEIRKKEILDLIAKEEVLLLKTLDEKGRAIVNLDDKNIKNLLPFKSKTLSVSAKDKSSDFYIYSISQDLKSFKVKFTFLKENYEITIKQSLPGYFANTLILAAAICFSCGVSIKNVIRQLEQDFNLPPGRFSVFKGIKESIILDSSYNSSLESATGAIETVNIIGKNKRKVAILGDMRELGSLSRIQHEQLARSILKNLDFAVLIGPQMGQFVAPILSSESFNFLIFDTYSQAKNEIVKNIKKNDLILIKGSQNTLYLERVVELLLVDKSDTQKLCRRGKFWDKKRKESS